MEFGARNARFILRYSVRETYGVPQNNDALKPVCYTSLSYPAAQR